MAAAPRYFSHGVAYGIFRFRGLEQIQSSEVKVRRHFSDFEGCWKVSTGTGALKPTILTMTPENLLKLKARVLANLNVKSGTPVSYEIRANVVMDWVIIAR